MTHKTSLVYHGWMERTFAVKQEQTLVDVTSTIELTRAVSESYEICSVLPASIGSGTMREIRLKEGVTLFIEDLNPKEAFVSSLAYDKFPVKFLFTVYGEVEIDDQMNRIKSIQHRGEGSLSFTTEPVRGSMEKRAGDRTTLVTLLIEPELLYEMIEDDSDRLSKKFEPLIGMPNSFKYYSTIYQNVEIEEVLNRILSCPYKGSTRRLFLESKAMELIVLVLDYFCTDDCRISGRRWRNPTELRKLYEARDILKQRMENPPGIFELAQEVGLSHTRLNRGFHELFDTTVFGYLKKLRIETARRNLESGEMNVTEAAYSVGYSSLSHFSMVFKQYTGVNPRVYMNTERKRVMSVQLPLKKVH